MKERKMPKVKMDRRVQGYDGISHGQIPWQSVKGKPDAVKAIEIVICCDCGAVHVREHLAERMGLTITSWRDAQRTRRERRRRKRR